MSLGTRPHEITKAKQVGTGKNVVVSKEHRLERTPGFAMWKSNPNYSWYAPFDGISIRKRYGWG